MKRISSLLFALLIAFGGFALAVPRFFARAQEAPAKYDLVSATFNAEDGALEKYNFASASNFTPFDYETETRMAGTSFVLAEKDDGSRQIENQTFNINRVEGLPSGGVYSLFMYVYFDAFYVHSLSISLNFGSGRVSWNFPSSDLLDFISKYSSQSISTLPHAWNLIELPLQAGQLSGMIISDTEYLAPTSITINYVSPQTLETLNFAGLMFFNPYLSTSNSTRARVVEKQDYRISSFNGFDPLLTENVIVGDSLKMPTLRQAVNYAWEGSVDLTYGMTADFSSQSNTYNWRIMVKDPEEEDLFRVYPGDDVVFEHEGIYQISYQCVDKDSSPVVSFTQEISVRTLRAIYFSLRNLRAVVGKTYVVNIYSSDIFSSTSDFTASAPDEVRVEYVDGAMEITPLKAGTFEISVSVEGARASSPIPKPYTVTFQVTASNPAKDNTTLKIVLWCALGVFVVILIGLSIKLLVKARRIDVK